ncbi:MAG: phage tail protein, partial [Propionibacteriaceae bacterium]
MPSQQPNARTTDPPFAGSFVFAVDGVTIGAFTEVSGLAVTMEIEEITEGGNNETTIKVPGRLKWPNLVLKRGITEDDNLFSWITDCSGDGLVGKGNTVT